MILQRKTQQPVQFEITEQTGAAVRAWIEEAALTGSDCLFPGRNRPGQHLTARHSGRLLRPWIEEIGPDPAAYGTHSLRRRKATPSSADAPRISGRCNSGSVTRSWRVPSATLGIEVEDALEIAEETDA
jgi:hypothetical protein